MPMDKKEALSIVFSCAQSYKDNLINRCLLFISVDKHKTIHVLEVTFDTSNFLHLTGFKIDTSQISPAQFFDLCCNKRLSVNDFEFSSDGTTELKMEALPILINKSLSANMIANYGGNRPKLYTEKLAGSVKASMGFIKDRKTGKYVPNTVLSGDIRDSAHSTSRIIATYRKQKNEITYTELVHKVSKGIDWSKIIIPEPYSYLNESINTNI